jgi:hypothetical protein
VLCGDRLAPADLRQEGPSLRLLIIEDEDRLAGILKSKLGDIGFTVDIASSAADATAALELINYGFGFARRRVKGALLRLLEFDRPPFRARSSQAH